MEQTSLDNTINQDIILKALETLGINVKDEDIVKGEKEVNKEDKKPEDIKEEGKEASEEVDEDENDEEFEKAMTGVKEKFPKKWAAFEGKKKDEVKKSEDVKEDIKEEVKKSEIDELGSKVEASVTLLKSILEENATLKKSHEDLLQKFTEFGSQTQGRKSAVTAQAIEKGFGQGDIQNQIQSGKKVLSLSQNKKEITELLFDLSGIEKGQTNDLYAKAALLHDASGMLDNSTIFDLNSKGVQIVN